MQGKALGKHPDRWLLPLAGGGTLMLSVAIVTALLTGHSFFQSYLIALLYWLALPLGALAWLMIIPLTGGRWGAAVASPLIAVVRTLPLMAIAFIPLLAALPNVYEWARDAASAHTGPSFQPVYLTVPFFIVRLTVYFAIWLGFSKVVTSGLSSAMSVGPLRASRRLTVASSIGLVLYVVTVSLAAVDWGMSLDRQWISTVYGLLFVTGFAMASMALVIVMLTFGSTTHGDASVAPRDALDPDVLHDLSKLLLTTVALWAYMGFSQLLIYWSGNVPAEISWYVDRLNGFWGGVFVAIVALHFFAPLIVLLSRSVKRNPRWMCGVAIALLIVHYVDLSWRIAPSFARTDRWGMLIDLLVAVGMGGIWLAMLRWRWCRRARAATDSVTMAEARGGTS